MSEMDEGVIRNRLEHLLRDARERVSASIKQLQEVPRSQPAVSAIADGFESPVDADLLTRQVTLSTITVKAIERALARLDDGEYGRCQECEGAIAPARLLAVPFASRCFPCQEEFEMLGPGRTVPA